MRVKLRQVGNSVGLTIPVSELKALSAKPGDTVELQITKVVHSVRDGWDDPTLWLGAGEEPLYLDELPENVFDREQWQW